MITNHRVTIEQIMGDTGDRHLIVCPNADQWCDDGFLIKSSPESKAFLERAWSRYPALKEHGWKEQQALIEESAGFKRFMRVVTPRFLWSIVTAFSPAIQYGPDWEWHRGDFMVHLWDMPMGLRIEAAKYFVANAVK